MRLICLLLSTILSLFSLHAYSGPSVFHTFVSDISPPYLCKLKLRGARGVSLDAKRSYYFTGICSVKIPIGTSWIYQNVWVDLHADWNSDTNEGLEVTTLHGDLGNVVAQLKCDDDPWLTKSQCAILGYQNNTNFTNLGGVYNERNGQYPPFEIITGQYPPLARNQAIKDQAIALSLLTAQQEARAAHTAFNKTFLGTPQRIEVTSTRARPVHHKRRTRVFKCPRVDNFLVDCCLRPNHDCGKPAADAFCQRMGYKCSLDCKIDGRGGKPTFILGTQTICNRPHCKGFSEIVCSD